MKIPMKNKQASPMLIMSKITNDATTSLKIIDKSGCTVQTLELPLQSRRKLIADYHRLYEKPDSVRLNAALVKAVRLKDLPEHISGDEAEMWASNVTDFLQQYNISAPLGYLAAHLEKTPTEDLARIDEMLSSAVGEATVRAVRDLRSVAMALETSYRRKLYELLQTLYAIAEDWRENPVQWKLFTSDREWEGRKRPPDPKVPEEALHYVLRFVFGMGTTEGNQRANKFSRALDPLFQHRVPARDVMERIEGGGGLEAMSRQQRRMPKVVTTLNDTAVTEASAANGISTRRTGDQGDAGCAAGFNANMTVPEHLVEKITDFVGKYVHAEIWVGSISPTQTSIKLIDIWGTRSTLNT